MFYEYTCEVCGEEIEKQYRITEAIPSKVNCPSCEGKKTASRNWKGSRIVIPESFRAVSWDNDDNNPASVGHISRRIIHSHPSGREGALYHQVPEMHIHGAKE